MTAEPSTLDPLVVSTSPHIRDRDSVERIMWRVVVALLPAWLWSWVVFGWYAAVVVCGLAIGAAAITEAVMLALRGKPVTLADGSAVVTGLLLAMTLPPNSPWYVPIVGAVFGIAVEKHCFGGLGHNIWNPALAGRVFVHFAYPAAMNPSAWPMLKGNFLASITSSSGTTVTMATALAPSAVRPLIGLEPGGAVFPLWKLAVGLVPGCIGEVSAIALLLGAVYLIITHTIDWRVPVAYVGTVFVFAMVLPYASVAVAGETAKWGMGLPVGLYSVLAGGLMLGAFFMATDMVTTPLTPLGGVVFAVGAGLLTGLIRLISTGFPEGVAFSILIMNTATPSIDRWTRPRVLGAGRKHAGKA